MDSPQRSPGLSPGLNHSSSGLIGIEPLMRQMEAHRNQMFQRMTDNVSRGNGELKLCRERVDELVQRIGKMEQAIEHNRERWKQRQNAEKELFESLNTMAEKGQNGGRDTWESKSSECSTPREYESRQNDHYSDQEDLRDDEDSLDGNDEDSEGSLVSDHGDNNANEYLASPFAGTEIAKRFSSNTPHNHKERQ